MKSIGTALVIAMLLASTSVVRGEEGEGWSWSKLNLLDKSSTAKKTAEPKYEPHQATTRAQSGGPSMFSKVGSSSKKMWKKTADTLTFKSKKTPAKPSSRFSSNLGSKKKKKSSDSSFFSGWFGDDKPREPKTAEEFVQLPRLEP